MIFCLDPRLFRLLQYGKRLLFDREKLALQKEVEKRQWLSRDELTALQWNRLKQLVEHAYENVPFYRSRFKEIGLEPGDIKSFTDFSKIPILTKTDVRKHREELLSRKLAPGVKIAVANTGGSTGIPLQFYRELENVELRLVIARGRRWYGWTTGERTFHIWAKYNEPSKKALLVGYYLFNAFDVTDEKMHEMALFLQKFKPFLIFGYVSTLVLFTEFLKANSYIVRPKAVEPTAEALLPQQRKLLEEYYQCPVIDFYGCNEIFACASQCGRNRNLHWFEDIRYAEIVDSHTREATDQEGELVITDLTNYSFPFIRYLIADIAKFSSQSCECGRAFRLIEPIKGKSYGTIITPTGKKICSQFFATLFYGREDVKQFQIIQHALTDIEFVIVPDTSYSVETEKHIKREIKEIMGKLVDVRIKIVDEIEPTKDGKRTFTISKVT